MLSRLLLPDKALKYFPPDFTLRDPVLSRVHRIRRRGLTCALLIFTVRPAAREWLDMTPRAANEWRSLIQQTLIACVSRYYPEHQIVGMKRIDDCDAVFLSFENGEPGQDELALVAQRIAGGMSHRLAERAGDERLLVETGTFLLEREAAHTMAAVQSASQFARAVAAKRLPVEFAALRQRLLRMLEAEDISVLAQPIMDLESGDIFGWELLTRGPAGGPLHMPVDLFPFAEQAGVLHRLEYLVIHKALREIAKRQIKEQVFLNITPVTLAEPKLLDRVLDWLKLYPAIRPGQIVFEITERHAIRDYTQMGDILRQYREHGFRFAIDDAGAGYSSLQSISELIPDMIKIDRSVIQNIDRQSVKQSLLKALLDFAEDINCQVIAEGVETEEEAGVLVSHRVRIGQGFYFSRPEPICSGYGHTHFADLKQKIMQLRQTSSA
ncbi:MAG: EAL domain-containing protein [Paenibacillaceae bacterium]|nr:EAL domain-containing protein [Paenibacillaceae bacterium]